MLSDPVQASPPPSNDNQRGVTPRATGWPEDLMATLAECRAIEIEMSVLLSRSEGLNRRLAGLRCRAAEIVAVAQGSTGNARMSII